MFFRLYFYLSYFPYKIDQYYQLITNAKFIIFFYNIDNFNILKLGFIEKYELHKYNINRKKLVSLIIDSIKDLNYKICLILIAINNLLLSNFILNYNIYLFNFLERIKKKR